jgi:hypothetical protein
MSLLQHRRARWFKALVQMPGEVSRGSKRRNACGLPSLTEILDKLQSQLAPVVVMLLWGLLMTGTLPRAWYYTTHMALSGCCALRAFIAIATKRVRTIKRIAEIQEQAPGTIEDKRRRKRTLKVKTRGVILDLFLVFIASCLGAISFLASQSFFSSRRLILNNAIAYTLGGFAITGANIQTHYSVAYTRKRRDPAKSALNYNSKGRVVVETELDGMSVVEHSCVDGTGDGRTKPSGGLFSEVETATMT